VSLSGPSEGNGTYDIPPARPVPPKPRLETIPAELRALPQWVMWKYVLNKAKDKWTKVPYQIDGAYASTTNVTTWTMFDTVAETYDKGKFDGIGFVTCESDPYLLIDLDYAIDPTTGEVLEWAADIVAKAKAEGAYIEMSPSGTGFHIIGRGEQLAHGGKRNDAEMYSSARFFTMTGNAL
jgi:putative DNA primase/helicase